MICSTKWEIGYQVSEGNKQISQDKCRAISAKFDVNGRSLGGIADAIASLRTEIPRVYIRCERANTELGEAITMQQNAYFENFLTLMSFGIDNPHCIGHFGPVYFSCIR